MPALSAERQLTQFRALSSAGKIDPAAGVIYGVSVITQGPALGHDVTVDEKGVKQCLEACQEFGDEGVKLVINHDSGFQEIVGSVKNFRISGLQLLGDAYLLDTPQDRAHILELAQKLPKNIGLSVETYGEPEALDKKKFWRVTAIDAIALVPNPAANKNGLFSKRVDNLANANPPDMTQEELQSAIDAAMKPLTEMLTVLESKVNDNGESTKLSKELGETKTKLEALEKKEPDITKLVAEAMKTEGEKIAADAVTKFAASCGLKPAPDGKIEGGSDDKTFEGRITSQLAAGANGRGMAIQLARKIDPKGFNDWSAKGGK